MNYSTEQLKQIEQFASIYLKISDMAVILGIPAEVLCEDITNSSIGAIQEFILKLHNVYAPSSYLSSYAIAEFFRRYASLYADLSIKTVHLSNLFVGLGVDYYFCT